MLQNMCVCVCVWGGGGGGGGDKEREGEGEQLVGLYRGIRTILPPNHAV